MRTIKTASDEERLILVGFEKLDAFRSTDSVGLFFIRAIGF